MLPCAGGIVFAALHLSSCPLNSGLQDSADDASQTLSIAALSCALFSIRVGPTPRFFFLMFASGIRSCLKITSLSLFSRWSDSLWFHLILCRIHRFFFLLFSPALISGLQKGRSARKGKKAAESEEEEEEDEEEEEEKEEEMAEAEEKEGDEAGKGKRKRGRPSSEGAKKQKTETPSECWAVGLHVSPRAIPSSMHSSLFFRDLHICASQCGLPGAFNFTCGGFVT